VRGQRTSENHVGYKPTAAAGTTSTSAGERGGLIQCNSSGGSGPPFDVVQIEQLTDTASLPAVDTPRARTRAAAAGILRHKETNF